MMRLSNLLNPFRRRQADEAHPASRPVRAQTEEGDGDSGEPVKSTGSLKDESFASVGEVYEVAAAVHTDRGCVRETNEDNGRHFVPNDPSKLASKGTLTIVADGMGGHASGEVASRMAVEEISDLYYGSGGGAAEALRHAFEEANRRIHAASEGDAELRGMGTTCTALVIRGGEALAAHVGDSRLYMLRDSRLYQLTEDHSAVMEMVRHGIITADEARVHADKNVILRALGTAPEVAVSMWERPMPVRPGDKYLLCSDGLCDLVKDSELEEALASDDINATCEELVALAKQRGGHDNITVGVLRIDDPLSADLPKQPRTTRDIGVTQ